MKHIGGRRGLSAATVDDTVLRLPQPPDAWSPSVAATSQSYQGVRFMRTTPSATPSSRLATARDQPRALLLASGEAVAEFSWPAVGPWFNFVHAWSVIGRACS